ncbi:hypothetical protein GCM10010193_67410 [Kitasatospora atroaurantiaca]|uniref:Uncharacterized protein n=1 Tax=Kitasatospora atroaurantiaca TaxID=285545 RepID=A0A561EHZ7_9ACTN|nr:hypothetical protein [Kitasatospora atroaurantiaca]TWE15212.1 hypothetical protein FB465_0091 [Kitasatospora atroaurantiaca]
MVWALVVREEDEGSPFAEAIVEVGPALFDSLIEDATDSGFALAAGEPPDTTASLQVRDDQLLRMLFVGGRLVWEPTSPVQVSPSWLSAARARQGVVVVIVPPGTWPPGLMDMPPQDRSTAFTDSLQAARAAGLAMHGMTAVDTT